MVAVMFRSARLRCPIEGEATTTVTTVTTVTWRFVKLGTEAEVVVYQTSRVVDAFNDILYANLTKDGRHELFIANTTLENAGDYYCLDQSYTKIVQLIVLGKDFYLLRFNPSFSLIQQPTSLPSPANDILHRVLSKGPVGHPAKHFYLIHCLEFRHLFCPVVYAEIFLFWNSDG